MMTFGTKVNVLGILLVFSMEVIDFDIRAKDYAKLCLDAIICGCGLFGSAYYLFWWY
jgi:hypothetical protein